ncbi:MAG TPA: hypothetical protein VF103_17995 [Polyangiaceae bacterium]
MKPFLRRAIAFFALLSAIASVLLAGQSYFFCPWMERTAKHCCCAKESTPSDGPAVSRAPCCERNTLSLAPGGPTNLGKLAPDVPAATGLDRALVPVMASERVPSRNGTDRPEHEARAGPHTPLFELHSTYLI